jgi:hypothetical protein
MVFICSLAGLALASSSHRGRRTERSGYSPAMQAKIQATQAEFSTTSKNLKTFDTLDYVVFSNQEWTRLHESHSKDVIVNWPDGHHTNGIQKHIEDLSAMFVYAPDTNIKLHPVRFGVARGASGSAMTPDGKIEAHSLDSGEGFTCVTGVMTGTFSKPMPIGDGKFIQPTGKSFTLPMCTVGHWKNGVMIEEWLYWDGATYMKQMGIGQ